MARVDRLPGRGRLPSTPRVQRVSDIWSQHSGCSTRVILKGSGVQVRQGSRFVLILAMAVFVASSCGSGGGEARPILQSAIASPSDGNGQAPAAPVTLPEPDLILSDFKVIGRHIVDPVGNIFVPFGGNIGAPLLDSQGEPVWLFTYHGHDITSPESFAAVQAWGWNLLRLNAQCGAVEATEINAAWGTEQMLAAIDEVVDLYTSVGIVVMLECHDLTGESPAIDSPLYQEVDAFWDLAAERYANNTYVWFNHLNEFHAVDDALTEAESGRYWQNVIDDAYEGFVDRGARNLLIFDLPDSGNDLGQLADRDVQAWAATKCNTIWSWHAYGGIAPEPSEGYDFDKPREEAYRAEITVLLDEISGADMPLIVGEMGYDWSPYRQQSNFAYASERLGALSALDLVPAYGYGLLIWHANGASGDDMIYGLKNFDAFTFADPTPQENLAELGEHFWSYSQLRAGESPVAAPPGEACQR